MYNNNEINSALLAHFGTTSPFWRLSGDSDAFHLSGDGKSAVVAEVVVALRPEQAKSIRALSGVTSHLLLEIQIFGEPMKLHLVGRKIDATLWAGTAADYRDTSAVARDLEQGLTFAEQVVSEVNSLVVIIDSQGKIKRFNRLCEELTGVTEESMLGKNAHDLFMPSSEHSAARANIKDFFATGASFEVERPVIGKYGVRQILWRNKLIESGSGQHETFLVCAGTDVTEERRAKARLLELANTDVLTGLPNRHAVQEHISRLVNRPEGGGFGLVFLDLDNFKKVNDHYGHLLGDALIQSVATAMQSSLRGENIIARLGGDEFLVVVDNASQRVVEAIAERILERMKVPFNLNHTDIYSSCSIGIAMYPEHGRSMEELVRSADTAMYVAKEEGRNTARVFTQAMNQKVSEFIWLDTNMRRALAEGQFVLYYQPKQNLKTGRVESLEALVRWISPERGLIGPVDFIPYAEESGLIVPLGKWVIDTAAKHAGEWKKAGIPIRVAVNMSARQLRHPTLIAEFQRAIFAEDIYPSLLDIELTESCLIDDEQLALDLIGKFQGMGAQIHLDDFGTGYSSLSQLSRLPLDSLKLDRSFISPIHNDIRAQRLLRSMVAVAHELQLTIVAEGVETQDQADFLRGIGVDYGQGYLIARPMPASEVAGWLMKAKKLRAVA
jgi:cyclic di-GMP phosphodiesterase Gmr